MTPSQSAVRAGIPPRWCSGAPEPDVRRGREPVPSPQVEVAHPEEGGVERNALELGHPDRLSGASGGILAAGVVTDGSTPSTRRPVVAGSRVRGRRHRSTGAPPYSITAAQEALPAPRSSDEQETSAAPASAMASAIRSGGRIRSVVTPLGRGVATGGSTRSQGAGATQNSLPSGSAITTQPTSPWPMSMRVAPRETRRSTSAC